MSYAANLMAWVRHSRMKSLAFLLAGFAVWTHAQAQQQVSGQIVLTIVDGVIGVSATRQINQAIQSAGAQQAAALIVQLDTPGGLVTSTRDIIKAIIASPVPIVVYVAPSGARAASAENGVRAKSPKHASTMKPAVSMRCLAWAGSSQLRLKRR